MLTYSQSYQLLEQAAPLDRAEPWDNVGLLLEPKTSGKVGHILLTIDLTEAVMAEAVRLKVDLIVAYHPLLFVPQNRITQADAKSRIILEAARRGLPVYAPHTALDNIAGGVNDWLADGLGAGTRDFVSRAAPDHPGTGRRVKLDKPVSLPTLQNRIRAYLGLKRIRVARASKHRRSGGKVRTIHLCAGAGSSVLSGTRADVFLTGEMRHHDILAANEAGTSVILCEHTNTERGYLPSFKKTLRASGFKGVKISISREDRDPVEVL